MGTLRSRWDAAGNKVDQCTSLPWGDGVSCSAASSDMMFTGKQRDTESGLDNFGARYYDSTMARFLTPDWSAHLEPVPYAKLNDPQSLDLYSYVENSPARRGDPDGHAGQPTGQSANNNWYGDVGVNDLELCQGSPVCFLYMLAQDVNSDAWNELQNAFQSLQEKPDPKNAGEQAQKQRPGTLDKDKFVNYMDKHAGKKSTGWCGVACRMGLAAGGLNTKGHPSDAGDYGPFLLKHGAQIVPQKNYKPETGDIIVFSKNQYHKNGHIEVYDGTGWVSDFEQHSIIPYRSNVPPRTIYRFPDGQ